MRLVTVLLGVTTSVQAIVNSTVKTEYGLLQGVASEYNSAITVFKGVPFAASTAGEARWRSPRPPASWEGVRVANKFGDICPETMASSNYSEDCLSLNIWTPTASSNEKLPVYVWIFGGRFVGGAASLPAYDGAGLAAKGVVTVTISYRLGPFGFLSTPELSKESGHNASGNYGLLDQIMALKYVQKNIAAFGGNPDQVTIGGQSAGAGSVLILVNSPLARGLFHGAIAESGARYPHDPQTSGLAESYRTLAAAEAGGLNYTAQHNVSTIAEMRKLSADKLLVGSNANDDISGSPPIFRPVLDGWVLPRTYEASLAGGFHADVPILTGNNKDESGASLNPNLTVVEYTEEETATYGNLSSDFFKLYPASNATQAAGSSNAAARDTSRIGSWLWGNLWATKANSSVYTYYWTHAPPGQSQGAYHGSEINYAFNNLYGTNNPWTTNDYTIAEKLSSYWANFIRTGNPNGGNLTHWRPSTKNHTTTMELGDGWGEIQIADRARIHFIQTFFSTQKAW
ncbi:carboxylesterase [Glonium stellatum]|uniref:Carboxylic ester hydrolase n=1 Tax=Glonium stellatum TaxID=574774 RepID=A0A8E2FDG6_9PEZI|nr:carboxylesterase [Glonium stellatum]